MGEAGAEEEARLRERTGQRGAGGWERRRAEGRRVAGEERWLRPVRIRPREEGALGEVEGESALAAGEGRGWWEEVVVQGREWERGEEEQLGRWVRWASGVEAAVERRERSCSCWRAELVGGKAAQEAAEGDILHRKAEGHSRSERDMRQGDV